MGQLMGQVISGRLRVKYGLDFTIAEAKCDGPEIKFKNGTTLGCADADTAPEMAGNMTFAFSGTAAGHLINASSIDVSGGYNVLKAGSYSSPMQLGASGILMVLEGVTPAAITTGVSTITWVLGRTEGKGGIIAESALAEANCLTSTGPTVLEGSQFMASVGANAYFSGSLSGVDGMFAQWLKIYCAASSHITGGAAVQWLDAQMGMSPSGGLYMLRCTSGGATPDSIILIESNASGYTQFIKFNSDMNGKSPIAAAVDTDGGNSDWSIKVLGPTGTQGYIPVFNSLA